ncbi:hypothetical protein FACS1894154_02900 [Betaproteobacteria bacterium]|nr:hypothetical protein AGMMS49543_25020 [Betaproteobacteria bacterium]GHT98118.1 hypothetical protein FACS1894154_02900 [Betaproteobacteria bacterium]GHU24369.1 hypothetical protein AGMMS50243_27400 [Betaproteobacteria bacterium]
MSSGKIVAGVVVVAALAAAGSTYVASGKVEDAFRVSLVEAVKPASGISVEVLDYERGFLNSTAKTRWTINHPDSGRDPLTDITLNHDIKHGPLSAGASIAKIHTELQTPEAIATELKSFFGDKPVLTVDSDIGWSGSQQHHISSSSFEGKLPQRKGDDVLNLSWGGIEGDITVNGAADRVQTNIRLPGFKASGTEGGDGNKVEIGAISITGDQSKVAGHYFWTGTSNLSIANFEFESGLADGRSARVEQISANWGITLKEKALDIVFKLALGKAEIAESKIDGATATLVYENLDIDALDNIARFLESTTSGEELDSKLGAIFLEQLPALLERKPAFVLRDVEVKYPDGSASLNLRVGYVGNGKIDGFNPSTDIAGEVNISFPRVLATRLLGEQVRKSVLEDFDEEDEDIEDRAAEIDEVVKDRVDQQLAMLTGTNLFEEKEGVLSSAVSYKEGGFEVNGKPFDISAFRSLLPF